MTATPIARIGMWCSRHRIVLLLAILAVAAALRVRMFSGYVGLDDGEYARVAYQIARGEFSPVGYSGPAVFPLRIGLTAPAAAAFWLFGASEWTMVLYPFVLSLATVVLAYCCAAMLFDERAGLIAAALMAVFPWDMQNATMLLPDLPGAFWAALAVALVLFVDRRAGVSRPVLLAGGLASGLAFGLSWLCKESVVYLAPFCGLLAIQGLRRHGSSRWMLWAGVAAGAGAVLLAETTTYYQLTGDYLYRFHEVERNYYQNQKYFFAEGSDFGWEPGESYARVLAVRLFVDGPAVFFFDRTLLFLPLVGVVATIYGWRRRNQSLLLAAGWLWSLVLMFNFASTSTKSYIPLALFQRYLYPVFLPAVLLVAGFVAAAIFSPAPSRARFARLMPVAGVLASALIAWAAWPSLYFGVKYPPRWNAEVRSLKDVLQPDAVLYADTFSIRALEFMSGYPRQTAWTDFERLQPGQELRDGSFVLVNHQYIGWLERHGGIWGTRRSGYRAHAFYRDPPSDWTRVWQNGNAFLYRVNNKVAQRHDR
jgi:4-amino-4-deoxy-L-arabinose transferase-like glycosyltransferase